MSKLVDILARELKVWPDENWPAIGQASNGDLHREPFVGGHLSLGISIAKDYEFAVVSRAEWQAAVDALKADECAHSYANKVGCPECGELMNKQWIGEGLPPVGTVCEAMSSRTKEYRECVVLAIRGGMAVVTFTDMEELQWAKDLRIIRTQEQIAAEERKAGIDQVMADFQYTEGQCTHKLARSQAERIWDAGYRKQEEK